MRIADRRAVLIKTLDASSGPRDRQRLENEYRISTSLDTQAAVRTLALENGSDSAALIYEDDGEEPLDAIVGSPLSIGELLRIGIGIAASLAEIHAQGVIHKNLQPANILLQRRTGAVKLTGFGFASRGPSEKATPASARIVEGALPYMSPEQTGRTAHVVDYRTDLYSLGVTLFELRAGVLPFSAADPLGWIHCHLAHPAPSLEEAAPGTPAILDRIVGKLLAKTPEDRYQSALGVRLDLERCLDRLTPDGRIEPFALGERDLSDRFQLSARLYGREQPLAELRAAFEAVAATGAPALTLVAGHAGVGKSALVRGLEEPVVRAHGIFVSGELAPATPSSPYSMLSRALGGLVDWLAAESQERLIAWRKAIEEALGLSAQLVVDVFPGLRTLIGTPPPAPELALGDLSERFRFVLRRFLGVFARREHPLVLFLDDLQWADAATLRLVEELLCDPECRYLLVIGAYRDNEVDASHPLTAMVETVGRTLPSVRRIALEPLSREALLELVADSVRRPREDVRALATLIDDHTAGNPLFATHLLTSLHAEELIQFDRVARIWRWDLAAVAARGFVSDVVDLMVRSLRRLPAPTLALLEVAATMSSAFELETLASICGRALAEVERDLWEAARAGLLVRVDDGYRFLHDRVQQAALSLIPEERRLALHLAIGRALRARTPPEELSERIFDIVGQLDQAVSLLDDPAEREQVAELDLIAAKRARTGTDWSAAIHYLDAGLALLGPAPWTRSEELARALTIARAECAYLIQDFDAATRLAEAAIEHCRTAADRAAPYCLLVLLRFNQGQAAAALSLAVDYLRLCGIEVPAAPTREEVLHECRRTLALLGTRAVEELVELPSLTDPTAAALCRVLSTVIPPAYVCDTRSWALFVCQLVRITLEHGNGDYSAFGYVELALVLGSFLDRQDEALRFGRLSLVLLDKLDLQTTRAEVFFNFALVCYWNEPIDRAISYFEAAFRAGLQTGAFTWACSACLFLTHALLTRGDRLAAVQREAEQRLEIVLRHHFDAFAGDLVTTEWFIQKLRGRGRVDERAHEQRIAEGWPVFACRLHICRLRAEVILGDFPAARAAAERARPLLATAPGLIFDPDFVFYDALARAQLGELDGLEADRERLARWAEACPASFLARARLVAAEVARLGGRTREAMTSYDQAIAAARERGFVHHQALANELAARFYAQAGSATAARAFLQEARACYRKWGADAKVRQLDELHPELAQQVEAEPPTFHGAAEEIDLLAVIKASQTISSEVLLDDLLRTLMRVMLAQSGAQRGVLFLVRERQLLIEAKAHVSAGGVQVERPPLAAVDLATLPPTHLLRRVAGGGAPLMVSDPEPETIRLLTDAEAPAPRSTLCLPIRRQAATLGYLYLENALAAHAFPPERLAPLEVLAAQAAISLENASLLARELAARQAVEASGARAAFLAKTGVVLAGSLDLDHLLGAISDLIVDSLADWCEIDLLDGNELRRLAGAHRDPGKRALLDETMRDHPLAWDSPHPLTEAARTGRSQLLSLITDETIRRYAADDAHARAIRALGVRSAIAVPLAARERVLGVILLVSATRRYEAGDLPLAEELARRVSLTIDSAQLYRKAREAVRLRDDFLGVAAHELKTPLTSLLLQLERLLALASERPGDTAALTAQLKTAQRQGLRLQRLAEDLLDVTQLEAGRLTLHRAETDLVALTHDVLDRFALALKRAQCTVRVDAPGPVRGLWDGARIDQVISNLISNAIKFAPRGLIEITAAQRGDRAELSVTDHGIGIDPARLGTIFDRFDRAVSATNYGGLGLGLYISRQIVQMHGGAITVRSRPGEGATFTFALPCGVAPGLQPGSPRL